MSNFVTNTSHKSRKVTLLLCIFGGWFGLHRYYVGKIGTGILYSFTLGMFVVGWILDVIKILNGTFADANGYPIIE